MSAQRGGERAATPSEQLDLLVLDALKTTKKARKHHQNLANDNFYGNKLAELRVQATNAFDELEELSAGDATAVAELVQSVFSAGTSPKARFRAATELSHALRTQWKQKRDPAPPLADSGGLFPLSILSKTNRSYLLGVGSQMNGCYKEGWYDACCVMMRRLVELSIIEAFEAKKVEHKIKDGNGNYLQLSDLVARAQSEATLNLSRNCKRSLPRLRDLGHQSAHGRYFNATKADVENFQPDIRLVLEEFLHHAGLL